MKKILPYIFVVMLFSGCTQATTSTQSNKNTYAELVSHFTEVKNPEDIESKSTDTDVIVYIGRETCPYCQIFVPKLYEAYNNTDTEIIYVDSDSPTEIMQNFLQKNNIKYVPNLSIFRDGKVIKTLEIDSKNISIEKIESFFKEV